MGVLAFWIYVVIITIAATIAGARLYYLGGEGQKLLKTMGMPILTMLLCFLITFKPNCALIYLLVGGLTSQNMTNYCKFGGQEDVLWYNWALTGLISGLVLTPMFFVTHNFIGLIVRTVILIIGTTFVSEISEDVKFEAYGRGGLFIATIPLILV